MTTRRVLLSLPLACAATGPGFAQGYPARPVRMIVPFAPGGSSDLVARLLSDRLSRSLGQQFIVENLPGATGNLGTARAARAAPDGHTILVAFSSHVINPSLFSNLPFDPIADFLPVTIAASATHAIIVHPSVQAATLAELVALVRARPGHFSFAHGGVGTPGHLLGEQLRLSTGIDLVAVTYSGAGPAVTSVLSGHTPIGVVALSPAAPHIREGRLRAVAVTSASRIPLLPEVPTTAEAGHPDIVGDLWVGVLVPARTPQDIVAVLHREIAALLRTPEITERLAATGFAPAASTPAEFSARMQSEMAQWRSLIRAAGIRME